MCLLLSHHVIELAPEVLLLLPSDDGTNLVERLLVLLLLWNFQPDVEVFSAKLFPVFLKKCAFLFACFEA